MIVSTICLGKSSAGKRYKNQDGRRLELDAPTFEVKSTEVFSRSGLFVVNEFDFLVLNRLFSVTFIQFATSHSHQQPNMATQTVTMPETMQACQIIEFNKPHQIKTIPTPSAKDLKEYDLLIKVAVPALCHSDLEYIKGVFPITLPVTASHEGTGTVLAFGSGVTRFQPGDRVVAGQTFGRCGDCEICNGPEDYRHYCPKREPMMSVDGRNGAFQEYLVIDGREATKIPDKMSFATAAPLACAGMTSWRAVKQAGLEKGEWLGIIGSGGGLGHLSIQFAQKAFGLKVVAVDARDEGLALSREMGADVVVDARKGKEAMVEEVMRATGKGVKAVIELSGHPTAAATGGAITRNHGRFVQVAIVSTISTHYSYVAWSVY